MGLLVVTLEFVYYHQYIFGIFKNNNINLQLKATLLNLVTIVTIVTSYNLKLAFVQALL
jgi:hypothetical protein